MRRTATLLLLTGALAAPVGSAAAFPTAVFDNVCRYSLDGYWRTVPMVFEGTLVDGAGAELTSGTRLAPGDTVRLRGGKVSATLPEWILPFAYDSELVPLGDSEIPLQAWLALEATNTAEGVIGPIGLTTVADVHVELTAGGTVDEERSTLTVVPAPLPELTWTAAGGEVQVRQGLGDALPPIPVGRTGGDVRVRGSLYVRATLGGGAARLDLDCLQGVGTSTGVGFTDWLPGTLGVFPVPGWSGAVDGTPLAQPVEADVLPNQGPPRAGLGAAATIAGTVLRLRLSSEQRQAWLGDAASTSIAATLSIAGERSVEGAQDLPVAWAGPVAASGPALFVLGVPSSTWTAATDAGIALRTARELTLTATVGEQARTLTLSRLHASDPYPFARVLRSAVDPAPTPIPTASPTPTPSPTATATVTPAPIAVASPTPEPTATPVRRAVLAVRSTRLKAAGRRVAVSLACSGGAACAGTLTLRTAGKVKLGSRARRVVAVAKPVRFRIASGRRATVRFTLTADGRALLKLRRKVAVRVASKRLTLSR